MKAINEAVSVYFALEGHGALLYVPSAPCFPPVKSDQGLKTRDKCTSKEQVHYWETRGTGMLEDGFQLGSKAYGGAELLERLNVPQRPSTPRAASLFLECLRAPEVLPKGALASQRKTCMLLLVALRASLSRFHYFAILY